MKKEGNLHQGEDPNKEDREECEDLMSTMQALCLEFQKQSLNIGTYEMAELKEATSDGQSEIHAAMQSERGHIARVQYELDMVNTKLKQMAEVMYKGCDQIHKAHMTTI